MIWVLKHVPCCWRVRLWVAYSVSYHSPFKTSPLVLCASALLDWHQRLPLVSWCLARRSSRWHRPSSNFRSPGLGFTKKSNDVKISGHIATSHHFEGLRGAKSSAEIWSRRCDHKSEFPHTLSLLTSSCLLLHSLGLSPARDGTF